MNDWGFNWETMQSRVVMQAPKPSEMGHMNLKSPYKEKAKTTNFHEIFFFFSASKSSCFWKKQNKHSFISPDFF